jgi:hypothetical protein
MSDTTEQEKDRLPGGEQKENQQPQAQMKPEGGHVEEGGPKAAQEGAHKEEGADIHSLERRKSGARGTAAMDPQTRKEVARKGGLAVSRNRQHMSEIGRKGGQSVSKNREHMAKIGRKGGAASRGGSGQGEQS